MNKKSGKDEKSREVNRGIEVKLSEARISRSSTERSGDVATKNLCTKSETTCHQELNCDALHERLENKQSEDDAEKPHAALQKEKSLAEANWPGADSNRPGLNGSGTNESGAKGPGAKSDGLEACVNSTTMEREAIRVAFHQSNASQSEEEREVVIKNEVQRNEQELRKPQVNLTSERNYVPVRPFDPGGDLVFDFGLV